MSKSITVNHITYPSIKAAAQALQSRYTIDQLAIKLSCTRGYLANLASLNGYRYRGHVAHQYGEIQVDGVTYPTRTKALQALHDKYDATALAQKLGLNKATVTTMLHSLGLQAKANTHACSNTGIIGVSFDTRTGSYIAYHWANGRSHYLGAYHNLDDAQRARKLAVTETSKHSVLS